MEPPERGHGVEQDMLEVDGEVEEHDRDDQCGGPRSHDDVQKSEPRSLARRSRRDRRDRSSERDSSYQQGVPGREREVPCPATPLGGGEAPAGREALEDREQGEQADERP